MMTTLKEIVGFTPLDDMISIVKSYIESKKTGVYPENSLIRKYAKLVYGEVDDLKCEAVGREVCEELACKYIELTNN